MVYDNAGKLYAEVRPSTEMLTDSALHVLYPGFGSPQLPLHPCFGAADVFSTQHDAIRSA